MLSRRYCRYCSRKQEDVRTLLFKNKKVKCLHCGRESKLESIFEGSPYVKVVRIENEREIS